jgi:hypothetical protein
MASAPSSSQVSGSQASGILVAAADTVEEEEEEEEEEERDHAVLLQTALMRTHLRQLLGPVGIDDRATTLVHR